MSRLVLRGRSLALVLLVGVAACGRTDTVGESGGTDGSAGSGGAPATGTAGATGTGGSTSPGVAGATGTGGAAGGGGATGTAGTGGAAGAAGTAGTTGTAGTGGATGGSGGTGTGGSSATTTIETIAQRQGRAGDILTVVCILSNGATAPTTITASPADAVSVQGDDLIAVKTGVVSFTCAAPSVGLVDATPAMTTILPGPAARVHTAVDLSRVTAGATVTAACQATDAYGNPVTANATLAVSPSGPTPNGLAVKLTAAGDYRLSCQIPGLPTDNAKVQVDPALPASLKLAATPMSAVYQISQVISVSYEVRDPFGNVVPGIGVDLSAKGVTGLGPVAMPAVASFRFDSDGGYEIDGTVVGPTASGGPVMAALPIAVDSMGPIVTCTSPAPGTVLQMSPGAVVAFQGTVTDVNGVANVTVNGAGVTPGTSGAFALPVTARYGLNYVDIVATDAFGATRRELCTFLVADRFVDEGTLLPDSVMLRLPQTAVDDNSRSGAINSLDDLLAAVLNAQGIRDSVDAGMKAANPYRPTTCEQSILGACVISDQIRYASMVLTGPNTVTSTLVSGGIAVRARFEDPVVHLRVDGTLFGNYDVTGDANFDFVELTMTFDVSLQGGRPRVALRANSTGATVGSISTTGFDSLTPTITNQIVIVANGTARNQLVSSLQGYLTTTYAAVLDSVLGGLSIGTPAATYGVPRVGSSGTAMLSFSAAPTSLDVTSTRMLFGMATRFNATATHARPPTRAPLPPNATLTDPNAGGQPVAVADHVGVYQQALQAFWRTGGLDGTYAPSAGGSVAYASVLPPVMDFASGTMSTLDIGLEATVNVPGILTDVHARAGVRATAIASLTGDALTFGSVTLDELHVVAPDVALGNAEQQALNGALSETLLLLATRSLNQVLPALPIPTFPIPTALATYNIPTGQLGPVAPTLTVTPPHFVLRGGFGLR